MPRYTHRLVFTAILACACACATSGQTVVRVATWNVQTVGEPDSEEFDAARRVLLRVGADVVAINEVDGTADAASLRALADLTDYPYLVVPETNPFGRLRDAFISRLPVLDVTIHTSAALSGDDRANDITRLIIELVVAVPGDAVPLTLVTEHFKSGAGNADEFRRACEAFRVGQTVGDLTSATDAYVLMGDVNEEIDSVPRFPNPFYVVPNGLPQSFRLGRDFVRWLLDGTGVVNDPYHYLLKWDGPATTALEALQLDGSDATRPVSGRRLDYILASHALSHRCPASEVYDSADEGLPGGLPKFGDPPAPETSLTASDHLLVFADLIMPRDGDPRFGDFDKNGSVDLRDVARFQACFTGTEGGIRRRCRRGDADCDQDVDLSDYAALSTLLDARNP